ncbi:hypothetical protein HGB41_07980 [Massilia sp. ML15P13]|uniref:Colicin D immunity protein domain-containing protein n=2 Tax=Telluria aromaticivorans TaxID=2725995 RepID=A0A7Y2K027_9BURK|nr:hypothetical protein [Telluria aromaticivorans]
MQQFIRMSLDADEFTCQFLQQWRSDRDAQWAAISQGIKVSTEERAFSDIVDRAFIAVDCYSPTPSHTLHLSAVRLRVEISELFKRQWQTGD